MAYIAPTSYEELQEECNTQRFLKLEAYVMLMSGYANPPIMPLPEDFKWLVTRIRWYAEELDRLQAAPPITDNSYADDTDEDNDDDYPDE